MDFDEIQAQVRREIAEAKEEKRIWREEQRTRKASLLGTNDSLQWQAPPAVTDFDNLLGEHAAQLRNAARIVMGQVFDDGNMGSPQQLGTAVSGLTRIVQANLAVARLLTANRDTSKTVHSAPALPEHTIE